MAYQQLTTAQAGAFAERLRPMLRFLWHCKNRLDSRGFDSKSELYRSVNKAYDAIHSLHVELHYQSCDHGFGGRHWSERAAPRPDRKRITSNAIRTDNLPAAVPGDLPAFVQDEACCPEEPRGR